MAQHSLKLGTSLRGTAYRIEKVLGHGSFGITYLATAKFTTQGNLGKMEFEAKVAIKEFFMSEVNGRSEDGSTVEGSTGSVFSNYRQKFRKEAENLSKLKHPNIVNVLDVFDENNTTYYVMQYIDGQSLDDYILQQNGIKESKAVSILKEIGKAVQYMHSNKMLHLDLKPKNVMLDKEGKVYLIDFGLSKQYDSKGEPESSTNVGAGTSGYAPIEQANYQDGHGFPVTMDVYALGATMFKMLTGVRPPEASEILNGGFPLYELQEHEISDRISASVAKAMAPVKKDRYQTVEDFLNAIEDEATIVDAGGSGEIKEGKTQDIASSLWNVLSSTKKVEIVFVPSFPSAGMYDATIKKDEIQIRSGIGKSSWTLSRKSFTKFLTSLNALNLQVRDKVNPEVMEASEDAAKLTITLYDDNNSVYAKYWIGGWHNQFGNIIGETLKLNEKIKQIIPHFEDFLNSSSESENKKDSEKAVKSEKGRKFLWIDSDTSKVRIEYWPYSLFPPQYNGAFITTVTPHEVNPNITQESTREMIPMTESKYKSFLYALQTLKLEIREEAVEQFSPGSFSPAKLKISLYDKEGVIYNDLWIDGMNGGNLVGNVNAIEKQIIQIVPGLSQYLNGPFYEVPDLIREKEIRMRSSKSDLPTHKDKNKKNAKRRGTMLCLWLSGFLSLFFTLFMAMVTGAPFLSEPNTTTTILLSVAIAALPTYLACLYIVLRDKYWNERSMAINIIYLLGVTSFLSYSIMALYSCFAGSMGLWIFPSVICAAMLIYAMSRLMSFKKIGYFHLWICVFLFSASNLWLLGFLGPIILAALGSICMIVLSILLIIKHNGISMWSKLS